VLGQDVSVTIFRDAHGIPHLRADSPTGVAREQGRACARDRLWQVEFERMRGEGRLAEWLGRSALEWDTFARRARLAEVAQRAFAGLDEETQAFVAAYTDGVNDVIATGVSCPELEELDARAEPWPAWTPLVIFLAQHILFGTFPNKLFRHWVGATVPEALPLFRTEGLSGGSNALAVGPGRTTSGWPLVAGDPHRTFEDPNVYVQVRLACPEFDVVGYTFPGVPGVQHFAHTGQVAWAITNAVADYQDLFLEELERRGDHVVAAGPHGWEPVERVVEELRVRDAAPVEVEVLVTARGPVILGGPDADEAISLRSPSWVLGDLGFGTFLPLLRARTAADVDAALAGWVEPVNNVVVADVDGVVLHRVAGQVPERPRSHRAGPVPAGNGDGWTGWVTALPRQSVAADACFATANDRGSAAYDVIADDFAPPFRADRIRLLLADQEQLDAEGALGVLADAHQNAGQPLLTHTAKLAGLSPAAARLQEVLGAWDGTMGADDPGAALFGAVRAALVDRICATPALASLPAGSPYGALFGPWFSLPTRVAVALHVWLAAERPLGLDLHALLRESVEEVATTDPPTWGERHVFHPFHGLEVFGLAHDSRTPPTPMPGDNDAVFAAGWLPGTSWSARGPVARYVWDLSDRGRSRWVVPLGASGLPGDPHQLDQHETWVAGSAVPVVTDWSRLTEESP
jgi:penicillin amidase